MDPIQTETLEKPKFIKTKKGKITLSISALAFVLLIAVGVFLCFHFDLFSKNTEELLPPVTTEEETETEEKEEIKSALPDDEIRGVYIASVSNINYPSKKGLPEETLKKEIDRIVETSRLTGFDTIYFQVRPSGDALYASDIFPTSRYLVANEGDEIAFDSLSYLIEEAKKYDMKVVAWVNPYRVTASKANTKEEALATLSANNPAKLHPDWTLFYGGKLYYNPGLSQVRDLIASGVKEICEGYDVAGVLYDDYFYPYPVDGEVLDDAAVFAESGTNLSIEDWRRENVNQMVKLSFDTIKSVSETLTFGISPFGIWKNASSDPKGSDTHGLEAYSALYCDALAWINGGYIDYISPQIYWERGYKSADFATLVRWWSAQVDGTGVGLVISHAAYKAADFTYGGDEIGQQISYARNYMNSCGSIQYGYADIAKNTEGIQDSLKAVFAEPFLNEEPVQAVDGISFVYPRNGVKTNLSAQFVSVRSDPKFPVYSSNGKVGRTKSGFISIHMPLAMGENSLNLNQNGKTYSLTVVRQNKAADALKGFYIASVTPSVSDGVISSSGIEIPVSVTAPAGCEVYAYLQDEKTVLSPTIRSNEGALYQREVYKGYLTVPTNSSDETITVGKIRYKAIFNGEQTEKEGALVQVRPSSQILKARVIKDYAELKKAPNSSFYDDYTPASVGMTDEILASFDGCYLLAFGGYILKEDAAVETGAVSSSDLSAVDFSVTDTASEVFLSLGSSPPISVSVEDKTVLITLFRTSSNLSGKIGSFKKNPLFSEVFVENGDEDGTVVLKMKLYSEKNFYGFHYVYEGDRVILSFQNPSSLTKGDRPLSGKTIALDAGHGGNDFGALGFYPGLCEKDLNLAITLLVRDKIESLGGNVLMTHEDDSTVSLNERMDFMIEKNPDFSISIHHNSTGEGSDANAARGTLGLFWAPSGLSLGECVQKSVKGSLVSRSLDTRSQKLALCRNHRFPQTLIEVSFICSPAEYERSMRTDYTEKAAEGIVNGILDWYRMQEGFRRDFAS